MTLNKILEEIDADEARRIVINRERERVEKDIELNRDLYKKTFEEIYKEIKEEAQKRGTKISYILYPKNFNFPEGENDKRSSVHDRPSLSHERIILNFAKCVKEHLESKGYKVWCGWSDSYTGYRLEFEIDWGLEGGK